MRFHAPRRPEASLQPEDIIKGWNELRAIEAVQSKRIFILDKSYMDKTIQYSKVKVIS